MRKQFIVCCLCILISSFCKSQPYKYSYYLDENLATIEKSKATIVGKGFKEDSLFRLDCFTRTGSRHYMTLHFSDSTLSDMRGPFVSYHPNGKTFVQGNYLDAYEEGLWQSRDSLGRMIDSSVYRQGQKMLTGLYEYHSNGRLNNYSLKDSLNDTYQHHHYDSLTGNKIHEAYFKGSRGLLSVFSTNGATTVDSVFTRELKRAEFPGGILGWTKYMRNNLDPLIPVNKKAPEGTYTVIIRFTVQKDGIVTNIIPETNHKYGMEKEVIRAITNGPRWLPARRFGLPVESFLRQPATFVINER